MVINKKDKFMLSVVEPFHEDIGRSVVRLNPDAMNKLSISQGDFVLIKGKLSALAQVEVSKIEDNDKKIIRMDSYIRNNVGTSLDEEVEVLKVEVVEADSVTIAPTQKVNFTGDPTKTFLNDLIGRPVIKSNLLFFSIMGTTFHYVVTKTSPKKHVRISTKTKLKISKNVTSQKDMKVPSITYDDIGGLYEEVGAIREMIEIPMKHPEVFERIGISPPRGVLLHGPPGTGKTLLARALANEIDAEFSVINGPEIMSKYYGESEKMLRKIFEEAEKSAPAIIFIDEIDSIAPNRDNVSGEAERRIVSQLLTLMDGLKGRGNVVVIAATNRPNSIDPALRRAGRFDREININPPTIDGRREILDVHTRGMPLVNQDDIDKNPKKYSEKDIVDLDKIAQVTHGFTGADLEVLSKEAAMKALKKWIPDLVKFEGKIPTESLEHIKISKENFNDALHQVEPSAMREVLIKKPNVRWGQVGGLDDAKRDLKEMVEMPLKEPEIFKEVGIKAPKGILLTGPPGTGKTLLAKAVATESEANFISIKGPELISKWAGESEKAIREIFKKAKQVSPSIIFFDEFDSIGSTRGRGSSSGNNDKIVNQLLTELDGVEELSGVSIIAATNRADLIDTALKRPGRLDSIVEVSLPDENTREMIFKIHTKNMPVDKSVNVDKLAKISDKFSGAMIEGVCQKAGLMAIRNRKNKGDKVIVTFKMFEIQIDDMKKNVRK